MFHVERLSVQLVVGSDLVVALLAETDLHALSIFAPPAGQPGLPSIAAGAIRQDVIEFVSPTLAQPRSDLISDGLQVVPAAEIEPPETLVLGVLGVDDRHRRAGTKGRESPDGFLVGHLDEENRGAPGEMKASLTFDQTGRPRCLLRVHAAYLNSGV